MAYSKGRNYRTKGRKSRKRRMKKGRHGKKARGARLKTQVSSLRRQVKKLIKSPAVAGKPMKNHRGYITRDFGVTPDVAAGGHPFIESSVYTDTVLGTCMARGELLGRTFPEFKMLPYITSPDDIFPHIMKGQSINLKSLTVSFDAIWPATYAARKFYMGKWLTHDPDALTAGSLVSQKICPDVEFLLVRYTSAAGRAAVMGANETLASHLFADQEYEDMHHSHRENNATVFSNPRRQVYAGVVQGFNPHKAEGFEDCHIVDRKIVKFRQPKWDECMEISTGNYLVPEVSKRVSLGVSYNKGKKIQLNPIPTASISRSTVGIAGPPATTVRLQDGFYDTLTFAEQGSYWTNTCVDDGFVVVARYAGTRVTGVPQDHGTEFTPIYTQSADVSEAGAFPFANVLVGSAIHQHPLAGIMATIQWQDCKFSCKYHDE